MPKFLLTATVTLTSHADMTAEGAVDAKEAMEYLLQDAFTDAGHPTIDITFEEIPCP